MFIYSETQVKQAPPQGYSSPDPSPNVPSWQYYTVKSGDTAWKIARKNWITLSQMRVLNPNIRNLNYLNIGQKVRVRAHVYKVKSGDTAWRIAQRYGMTLTELKLLNPQDETIHSLYVGQGLYVR
ncbi:LysM peptidoglycan-binding domain-containing protein [Bacillus sp. FJAT-47783]|uniref:LysM peptidoglycan-binding domain-containing protein n=1 Tax=Bacillus sp. FJAT-47783 TaxID=2922712 RepID=UPI001FAC14AA|nr:LysM peptidoglycan-binding domain-containing protein [Bacillus sp. FJAT-47783]